MKVLHIITSLNDGGAEAVLYRMATSKSGSFKHVVISLMGVGKYGLLLEKAGISVYYLNMSQGRLDIFSSLKIFTLVKKHKPDVVQTWMFHSDLLGGIFSRLAGVKNVVWGVHHTTLVRGESKYSTILIAKLNAFLSKFIPNKIIYCAERTREVQESIGFCRSKGVVVSNGYDVSKFTRNDQLGYAFKNELDISDNFLIGHVGRYNPQKDHKNLLLALKKVKDKSNEKWYCILVGSNLDETNSRLTGLVNELGLSDNVRLFGCRNDIPAVMNAIDLFVLSSAFGEAFPNVLMESMSRGVVCISSDVGDSFSIMSLTGYKIVDPCIPMSIANAINSAVEDFESNHSSYQHKSNSSISRIKSNYRLTDVIEEYNRIWLL